MEDYNMKLQQLLNPQIYKILPKDPTNKFLLKTKNLIKYSSIPDTIKRELTNTEAISPRLYGLPKIHKANVPLRPIVSTIGSPTYGLSKYLTRLLQPHIGQTTHHIKNSDHFIECMKNFKLEEEDILVSFDVISLFTKVPLMETLKYIKEIFPKDVSILFHHCLTTTYFQWNKQFFEQVDGVAMGNPLSPVIANFYMEKFESIALESAVLKPKIWYRYVDDTFVIWNHGLDSLHFFLKHLNNIHPNIQFTMECEINGRLPFLDILISKTDSLN
ncbi:hypothetical protein RI129_006061 [Pyrocoelia pectoralis]|uniref:Reverse transcriptase domain-containing protein n=1 Tax=Pyrocoelia pectoralis TaxID=417401 RepID=A0AAN7VGL0_9COLE